MVKKNKKTFYEKFNPVELWMWRNKKHFGGLLKMTSHCGPYGSRNSKWRYDFSTGEFVWNRFHKVSKCEWEKEPKQMRIPAEKLLKASLNNKSPMWLEFQKAVKQKKEEESNDKCNL
tara:strand:- start:240 stop:590 length:351 start_codon:yes stop_codon:yes gene_type:complete